MVDRRQGGGRRKTEAGDASARIRLLIHLQAKKVEEAVK